MVFTAELMRTHSFSDHLTEDVELQLTLLLEGTTVAFAADAEVRAEMPTTLAASRTQHERWEQGRCDLARRFAPRLCLAAVRARGRRRLALADAAADQLVPPFSVLAAGAVAGGGLALLTSRRSLAGRLARAIGAASVVTQATYVLSGLRMVHAPAAVYRSLARAPALVVWKLALWLRVLVRPGSVAWVRTSRNERAA
jgi:hypothetical protein